MPLPQDRFHDYDISRFKTSGPSFTPRQAGRGREREVTLLPTRPDIQEQPVTVSPAAWEGVKQLAKRHHAALDMGDMTAGDALRLAKTLEVGLRELDDLRQAVEATIEVCKRARGLRVAWQYANS